MTEPDFGQWNYQSKLEKIVDGDTFDVTLDLGFSIHNSTQRLRLLEIDTAEIYGTPKESETYREGMRHRQFVDEWFAEAIGNHDGEWPLIVRTQKDEKGRYGRWLAAVIRKSDGESLADALVEEFGEDIRYE